MATLDVYSKQQSDSLLDNKADTSALISGLSTKQDTLVSGTNIKTINGNSVLGSGDISISGSVPAYDVNNHNFTFANCFFAFVMPASGGSTLTIQSNKDFIISVRNSSGTLTTPIMNGMPYLLDFLSTGWIVVGTKYRLPIGEIGSIKLFIECTTNNGGSHWIEETDVKIVDSNNNYYTRYNYSGTSESLSANGYVIAARDGAN